MAIRLKVDTGAYPCTWHYRDQDVAGELTLPAGGQPHGLIFDVPDTWRIEHQTSVFEPHTDTLETLRGRTRDGRQIVLLDVRVQHFLPTKSLVFAGTSLVGGTELPDDLLFDSVEYQVGGLTELSGVHPFKNVTVPNSLQEDVTASVTWNSTTTSQKWITDDGDELELYYAANIDKIDFFQFHFRTWPVLLVSGTPRTVEQWLAQYVRPLAEITTVATVRPQQASWLIAQRAGKSFQVFSAEIAQQPYYAVSPEAALRTHGISALIRLGPDGATLPDLLAGWNALRESDSTFFDYLTVALRDTMRTKTRFLALVPALESLHGARHGDGPIRRGEYKRLRRAVMQRLDDTEDVTQVDVDFVRTWLTPIPSYRLDHRLRELAELDLGDRLRRLILSQVDPLPLALHGLVDGATDVWSVMATARNRLAHGGTNQPSHEQLEALTRLAHTVAIGLALRLLGVPDTALCQAINYRRWPVI